MGEQLITQPRAMAREKHPRMGVSFGDLGCSFNDWQSSCLAYLLAKYSKILRLKGNFFPTTAGSRL
jgi:hypothetical protein